MTACCTASRCAMMLLLWVRFVSYAAAISLENGEMAVLVTASGEVLQNQPVVKNGGDGGKRMMRTVVPPSLVEETSSGKDVQIAVIEEPLNGDDRKLRHVARVLTAIVQYEADRGHASGNHSFERLVETLKTNQLPPPQNRDEWSAGVANEPLDEDRKAPGIAIDPVEKNDQSVGVPGDARKLLKLMHLLRLLDKGEQSSHLVGEPLDEDEQLASDLAELAEMHEPALEENAEDEKVRGAARVLLSKRAKETWGERRRGTKHKNIFDKMGDHFHKAVKKVGIKETFQKLVNHAKKVAKTTKEAIHTATATIKAHAHSVVAKVKAVAKKHGSLIIEGLAAAATPPFDPSKLSAAVTTAFADVKHTLVSEAAALKAELKDQASTLHKTVKSLAAEGLADVKSAADRAKAEVAQGKITVAQAIKEVTDQAQGTLQKNMDKLAQHATDAASKATSAMSKLTLSATEVMDKEGSGEDAVA